MSVTLLEVFQGAQARTVPLPAENAGYLVLSLCERALPSPRRVALDAAELDDDGGVRLLAAEPADAMNLEQALRRVLGELLSVASSAGPSLVRAASRPSSGNLPGLVAELERALVPVNRTAARRALVRLCRETERARREGTLAPVTARPEAAPVPAPAAALAQSPTASARPPAVASPLPPPMLSPLPVAVAIESVPLPAVAPVGSPEVRATKEAEAATSPETVVALSDSRRPPGREPGAERTPCVGSFGLDLMAPQAPVIIEEALSPDLPTAVPPPYAGEAQTPRDVGELVAKFEVGAALSDDSLRAELKRFAGVEATPGPDAVSAASRPTR